MLELNSDNFNKEIKENKLLVIDLWAEWCIEESTQILTSDNIPKLAKEINNTDILLTYNGKEIIPDKVKKSFTSNMLGHCKEIITKTGRKIKVTDEHEFLTPNGWKKAEELKQNEKIAVMPEFDKNKWEKIEKDLPKGLAWEDIKETKEIYLKSVQKISMENNHNFIANGFLAHNCGPCKAMSPIFEELSKEMKEVKFAKLNVDDNQNIAQRLSVLGIPTFIMFKDGKEIARVTGARPKSMIKSNIEVAFK